MEFVEPLYGADRRNDLWENYQRRLERLNFQCGKISMEMWLTASFLQAIPGIVIQLALIPLLVLALQKARLADRAGAARV